MSLHSWMVMGPWWMWLIPPLTQAMAPRRTEVVVVEVTEFSVKFNQEVYIPRATAMQTM